MDLPFRAFDVLRDPVKVRRDVAPIAMRLGRAPTPARALWRGLRNGFTLTAALCGSVALILAGLVWIVAVFGVLLVISGYLAKLAGEVVNETIPASEAEQRSIDWLLRDLPAMPAPVSCDECGRLFEDCACTPEQQEFPCDEPVRLIGRPSNQPCAVCGWSCNQH